MEVNDELQLIREAREKVANLEADRKKIYQELAAKIKPSSRLDSSMWDYVINGVSCYLYDIDSLLKNRQKNLDEDYH